MSHRNLTFYKDVATEAEAWEEINKKAIEEGFNPFYKYQFSEMWEDSQKCQVYESYFEKDVHTQTLHLTLRSKYKFWANHKAQLALTINND